MFLIEYICVCIYTYTYIYFFLFTAAPAIYGSSQVRGQIRAAAAGLLSHLSNLCHSYRNAESLTHWSSLGTESATSQRQHRVLDPLSHNRNSNMSGFLAVWMNNIASHIRKQRMLQPSSHHFIATLTKPWALRELQMETGCCHQTLNHCSHPPMVHPEETQDEKAQDTGPRQLRCISKGWFQWARLLRLPYIEKH